MSNTPDHAGLYWAKDCFGEWAIVEIEGKSPFMHITKTFKPGPVTGFQANHIVEWGNEIKRG